ncbi:hydroxyacylglutathione hydrolase [Pseudomonas stutzeri]|uniref:Hydroxyacylglutathione hydrolase n=1 Tax=Stutzerimonas stutzeri TaxID=316 RepID=A0A2N8S0M7_STUST|nr:hydroxyacylglutathione hydrolase [Stutzerimonas stutzeri]MCQ4297339.1 hydroxyacylglutathione hydrolase [Stutzerimonas stutzeri]PNF80177.1 hydroxyacylglutathione hydrolase [Stutzerimonas stutzeri]
MLKIEALPAFTDNYIWLLQDDATQRCVAVDPGDAAPVLSWLQSHPDWQLSDILITHHHHDHVGGVERLKTQTGARVYGPAAENIPARDEALSDGQRIRVLDKELQAIAVPGHTLGHIAYFHADAEQPWLLSGDTLFAAGCGRLFEGTPEQMFDSLQRLATMPDRTLIYCTHEYTLSNLRFSQAVEPSNPDIQNRMREVTELREANRFSLPTRMDIERATNPFLRSGVAAVQHAASEQSGRKLEGDVAVFAALRAWKDRF